MKDIADNLKQIAELEDRVQKENAINEQLKISFEENEINTNEEIKKIRETY